MTSASKICLFLIAIAIAAPTLLLLKFRNDSIKRSERPPTQAQIDDFFKVSGIASVPKDKIVYFLHGPDWEDPANIFAMDKKVEFYKIALKLGEIEAKQFVSNEVFLQKRYLIARLHLQKNCHKFLQVRISHIYPYLAHLPA